MNRRQFITTATVTTAGATFAMGKPKATEAKEGACGLSCSACRMKLNGTCQGCGQGKKANCAILKCAQEKKLQFCAQCKGYPCKKIKDSGKFGAAWLDKMAQAPIPAS